MNRLLKILFFAVIVRPLVLIVLGLNIRNRHGLPAGGPAVIAANHNSHLDTLVLMSLFPLSMIHRIRPVAAGDYFLRNRLLAWFAKDIIGILAIERSEVRNLDTFFAPWHEALDEGNILIVFPEGSRGKPEKLGAVKRGLFHLVSRRESTPVIPIVMYGLGRALPRGEALFVPFNCDVIIGEELPETDNSREFAQTLTHVYEALFKDCLTRHVEA